MGPRRGGVSLAAGGIIGGGLPMGPRRIPGVSLAPVAGVVSVGAVVTAGALGGVESGFVAYLGLSSQPAEETTEPTAANVTTKEAASDERLRMVRILRAAMRFDLRR
jgi:hypothetical protein